MRTLGHWLNRIVNPAHVKARRVILAGFGGLVCKRTLERIRSGIYLPGITAGDFLLASFATEAEDRRIGFRTIQAHKNATVASYASSIEPVGAGRISAMNEHESTTGDEKPAVTFDQLRVRQMAVFFISLAGGFAWVATTLVYRLRRERQASQWREWPAPHDAAEPSLSALRWQGRANRPPAQKFAWRPTVYRPDLPDQHKTCIFRVVQERPNDGAGHALAQTVRVQVQRGHNFRQHRGRRAEFRGLGEAADGWDLVGDEDFHVLNVSLFSIETHRAQIVQERNLHSVPELMLYAVRKGSIC